MMMKLLGFGYSKAVREIIARVLAFALRVTRVPQYGVALRFQPPTRNNTFDHVFLNPEILRRSH